MTKETFIDTQFIPDTNNQVDKSFSSEQALLCGEDIEHDTYCEDLDAANTQGSDPGDPYFAILSSENMDFLKEQPHYFTPSKDSTENVCKVQNFSLSNDGIPPSRRPCAHSPAKYSKPGLPFRRPSGRRKMKLPPPSLTSKEEVDNSNAPKSGFSNFFKTGVLKYKAAKQTFSSFSAILDRPSVPEDIADIPFNLNPIDFCSVLGDDSSSATSTDESSVESIGSSFENCSDVSLDESISDDSVESTSGLSVLEIFEDSKVSLHLISFLSSGERKKMRYSLGISERNKDPANEGKPRSILKSWLVEGRKCEIVSTKSFRRDQLDTGPYFSPDELIVKEVLTHMIEFVCDSGQQTEQEIVFKSIPAEPTSLIPRLPLEMFEKCLVQQTVKENIKSKQDYEGYKVFVGKLCVSVLSMCKSRDQFSMFQDGVNISSWKSGIFKRKKLRFGKKCLGNEKKTKPMDRAALCGHLFVLKLLKSEGFHCSSDAIDFAAEGGHLTAVEWLNSNTNAGCTSEAMDRAAQNGHIEVLKFLHENRSEGCTENALDFAAQNGYIDIVHWLHQNRDEGCSFQALDLAAMNGHLNVVEWFAPYWSEGFQVDSAMDLAAYGGHLPVLEWMYEASGITCTHRGEQWAESRRHTDVIKWLRKMVISDHEEVQIVEDYFGTGETVHFDEISVPET